MRRVRGILAVVCCALFLSGCSGRELEDREFPSVITVPEGDFAKLQEKRQSESTSYLDYSHTKAVIFKKEVVKDRESLGEVLEYFESHPEFARNMLVFVGDDKALEKASEKKAKLGMELQDHYKNQPKDSEERAVTLTELWNYWKNQEKSLAVPEVTVSEEGVKVKGELEMRQEG